MDLQTFLTYVSDGAYCVFDGIANQLANSDIKALRLVMKPISDSLFPYMFKRLFLSVHDTDLEVFRRMVQHPIACRNITRICWDGTFCESELAKHSDDDDNDDASSSTSQYIQALAATKGSTTADLQALTAGGKHPSDLRGVLAFWRAQAQRSERNTLAAADLILLKTSLPLLPRLRRIDLLSRRRPTRVHPTTYLSSWETPRTREWAAHPHAPYLLDPSPFHRNMPPDERESIRSMRCLIALCEEGLLRVGSIVIAPFGRHTRATARAARVHGDLESPGVDLAAVTDTDTDTTTTTTTTTTLDYPRDPSKLTVRLMIEATPDDSTAYATAAVWETHVNMLIGAARHDLEALTLHEPNLDRLTDRLAAYPAAFSGDPHPLSTCAALTTLRVAAAWSTDPYPLLAWLRDATAARRVELRGVYSARASWHAVLTRLRRDRGAANFDAFDLVSCRSPAEMWGFSLEILAPWNGESRHVVPWLRGETEAFPLWQGPG